MAQRPSVFSEGKFYLQSYLNTIPDNWNRPFWPAFFPLEYSRELSYRYLIADETAHVTADVIAYDASAPEKTRRAIEKMYGDIPKLALTRVLGEIEMLEWDQLKNDPNVPDKKILNFMYEDSLFCFQGVQAERDALALEALSTFQISLTTAKNAGGVNTQTTIDFGLPAANKRKVKSATAARSWDNGTTSNYKPITDIWDIMDAATDAGRPRPKYALMDLTQWRQFCVADEVLYYVQPQVFNERTRVNLTEVNTVLPREGLPQILVIDKQVNDESQVHGLTQRNPWTTGYVTFLPDLAVGKMLYGPSAEKLYAPKQVTQAERDGILITKWSTVNPVREFTKGESNCFPVIPNVRNCFRFHATGTPEADGLDN